MEKRLDVQKRRDGKGLDRKRRTEGEKRRKKQKERGATTELTHLLTSAGSVSTRRTSCRRRIGRNQAMTSPSLEILKLVVVHTLCLGLATTCKHLREIRPLQEYVVAQAVRELGTLGTQRHTPVAVAFSPTCGTASRTFYRCHVEAGSCQPARRWRCSRGSTHCT